jgi:GntR family transcriptional regulator, transcriptional repressor for pyruvate dehydrogenase complex
VAFQLRAIDRSKLYTSIVAQIVDGIRSGAFPPGASLPAERVLAVQLHVSRSSVREAIRVLEHAGVVDVRTGSGTYVADEGLPKAPDLRVQAAMIGEHSPLDVIVARRALEPTAATVAAEQRNPRDLDKLTRSIDQQADLLARGADPADADLNFHLALAYATHNPVVRLLAEHLIDIMRQDTWRALKFRSNEHHGTFQLLLEQHRAILDAVSTRDPAEARRATNQHLATIETGLRDEVATGG